MGGLSEAAQVLRRHVVERRRRASPRGVLLDGDPSTALVKMSEEQFASSCGLVKGVPEETLDILEVWVCESKGGTWSVDVVEIAGQVENVPLCQIALRLTLKESAERIGIRISNLRARELYRDALATVTDNLVRRAQKEARHAR